MQGDIAQQSADALTTDADGLGCESLALPALGCGVAGSELAASARLIVEESDGFAPESLSAVRFLTHGDSDYETLSRVADEMRGGNE